MCVGCGILLGQESGRSSLSRRGATPLAPSEVPAALRACRTSLTREYASSPRRREAGPQLETLAYPRETECSSPLRSMPVSRCETCRKPRPTPIRGPRCATTAPEYPSIGTPPTSSRRSSPVPPADSPSARRPADLQVAAERLAHDLRRRRVLSGGSLVESTAQLRFEPDRKRLGRRRAHRRSAARPPAEFRDVEAFLCLIGHPVEHSMPRSLHRSSLCSRSWAMRVWWRTPRRCGGDPPVREDRGVNLSPSSTSRPHRHSVVRFANPTDRVTREPSIGSPLRAAAGNDPCRQRHGNVALRRSRWPSRWTQLSTSGEVAEGGTGGAAATCTRMSRPRCRSPCWAARDRCRSTTGEHVGVVVAIGRRWPVSSWFGGARTNPCRPVAGGATMRSVPVAAARFGGSPPVRWRDAGGRAA